MDCADCMTRKARGLCLDCMDGADYRKAFGCPGEHDGSHLASKQATFKHDKSLTAFQNTYYIHRRAEPNCNNKHRKLFACPTKVHVTLKASDRRDNGCIANYSPLLTMALACPNWHKLFIDEARIHVFAKRTVQTARTPWRSKPWVR
jgi:hypothetical protein